MGEKFTKEHINQIVVDSVSEIANDICHQYAEMLNQLDDKEKDNHIMRETIAISIAQSNMALVITDVLYKLLNQK